jgi:hypothetical protein
MNNITNNNNFFVEEIIQPVNINETQNNENKNIVENNDEPTQIVVEDEPTQPVVEDEPTQPTQQVVEDEPTQPTQPVVEDEPTQPVVEDEPTQPVVEDEAFLFSIEKSENCHDAPNEDEECLDYNDEDLQNFILNEMDKNELDEIFIENINNDEKQSEEETENLNKNTNTKESCTISQITNSNNKNEEEQCVFKESEIQEKKKKINYKSKKIIYYIKKYNDYKKLQETLNSKDFYLGENIKKTDRTIETIDSTENVIQQQLESQIENNNIEKENNINIEIANTATDTEVLTLSESDSTPIETNNLPTEPVNYNVFVVVPKIVFIVPYRDREQQYNFFSNHMKTILEDYPKDYCKIYYIHQCDSRSFNRGAMKNIGFIYVKNKYPNDYKNITLVFNDIDIMPFTKNFLNYDTHNNNVKHFYGFNYTLGGIVSIKAGDFEKINGFPNFWTWGYEDNLLQRRVIQNKLNLDRSEFYPIMDKNMLVLHDGITRLINRKEFNRYLTLTKEGIYSIHNIIYNANEDTGFIDVNYFITDNAESQKDTLTYDLRNGPRPFKNVNKRNPKMSMIF